MYTTNFLITGDTDAGVGGHVNQDCYFAAKLQTAMGDMAFCVLCDGMGGLSFGEVASATVVSAFRNWAANFAADTNPLDAELSDILYAEWMQICTSMNERLADYGRQIGQRLGTTVNLLLLTEDMYYSMNIGDSRTYLITNSMKQISYDHSLVAEEVRRGIITQEQARIDPRRSILTQCVGASRVITPSFQTGPSNGVGSYLMCSDGFYHEISDEEFVSCFGPGVPSDAGQIQSNIRYCIDCCIARGEQDNLTGVILRKE